MPNPSIHIGPLHIQWGLDQLQYWYLLLVILVIIVLAFRRLENSRIGRAWAAVREDEVAAQATGINTTRVKLLAFAIGASTSGVAGVFFASQIGSFTPDNFVLNNSILIVAYVVFGGMGSLPGAMAGAAMLTWLPEFLKDQVPPADRLMWIGAVLMHDDDLPARRPHPGPPSRRRAHRLRGRGRVRNDGRPSVRGDVSMTAARLRTAGRGPRLRRRSRDAALRRHHQPQRRVAADAPRRDPRGHRPNGAGKTSLFNSLTGVYTPQEGRDPRPGACRRSDRQRHRQADRTSSTTSAWPEPSRTSGCSRPSPRWRT